MTDYYRFEQSRVLNLVATSSANIVYDGTEKLAIASGLESVHLWNVRTGSLHHVWADENNRTAEVTCMSRCPSDASVVAVGYSDGSVRLWESAASEPRVTFHGHDSAVSALAWEDTGSRLASGSRDCDIVVWDVLRETGLYRLRGHTNGVTQVCFVENLLVSTSRDTFVKLWDLATQHCLETIVTHRAEITAMVFDRAQSVLMTFGADQQIRLFKASLENAAKILSTAETGGQELRVFEALDAVDRTGRGRVLAVAERDGHVCVLASDKSIEVLRVNQRGDGKRGRAPKKLLSTVHHSRFSEKPVAFDVSRSWSVAKSGRIRMVLGFANNSVQEWTVPLDKDGEKERLSGVEFAGHRTDVKALCLSSDSRLLASVAGETVKIWNVESGVCIRTFAVAEGCPAAFVPGDKHLMVASRAGLVSVLDLVSGNAVIAIEAHAGAVWALQIAPDTKGFVTGGVDKTVKFWEFKTDRTTGGLGTIKHIKTLHLTDEVLAVKYSPDMRLLAVALLDMTVKVFFEDSLKLALSLYGHKLPVTALDISSDSALIVTVSADKNIKVWSLQFGDCRKSIFAHQEAITYVSFLGRSTEFVTASKDRTIRYWDASKFLALQKIITGHHGDVVAAAVSHHGDLIVTASSDKSIRLWRKTEELLFPEEEQEREMGEVLDASMLADASKAAGDESSVATKATIGSMKAGERVMEAIEAANREAQKASDVALARENGIGLEPQAHEPLLLAAGRDKTPAELVMWAIVQVPLAELEEALMTLPVSLIPSLLGYVIEWFHNRLNIVIACRVLDLLLKVYYDQLIFSTDLRVKLQTLRDIQKTQLSDLKDATGYNIAVMRALTAAAK